jgi:hypothetical protein
MVAVSGQEMAGIMQLWTAAPTTLAPLAVSNLDDAISKERVLFGDDRTINEQTTLVSILLEQLRLRTGTVRPSHF